MKSLPTLVKEDQRLEQDEENSTLALMRHRAEVCEKGWTGCDPKHIVRDYAAAIGKGRTVIYQYNKGWQIWQAQLSAISGESVERLSPAECLLKARSSAERQMAVEAVAKAKGLSPVTVAQEHLDDVRYVESQVAGYQQVKEQVAPKLAQRMIEEPHQTANRVATQMERHRQTDRQRREEARSQKSQTWLRTTGCLARAIYALRDAVVVLREADEQPEGQFQKELSDDMTKIQSLVDLLNLMNRGESGVNWDLELRKVIG
jgi:hypothetical protein